MADHVVSSIAELRQLYREPSVQVQAKKGDRIGPETERRLAASPFCLVATSDASGSCDVSPRGGPPGLLKVIDDKTVALPDLGGNNLVDSLTNIISNPQAGLLVLSPGNDETVRIDGPAHLSTDPAILSLWDGEVRRPKLAVVITVDAVFIHCAKAFRRSSLWDPSTWQDDVADACALLSEHVGVELDVGEMRDALEQDYATSLAAEQPG